MKMKSVFIPVPVEERMPENKQLETGIKSCNGFYHCEDENNDVTGTFLFKSGWKFFKEIEVDPYREENVPDITHWLEKKEDVFVLTKEELEKVFQAGRKFIDRAPLIPQEDFETFCEYDNFNDWLNHV